MKRLGLLFILVAWLTLVPRFNIARAQNWVDSDCAQCLEDVANDPNKVCKCAYSVSTQNDFMVGLVRGISGDVPGITVTGDIYQRNPQYAQEMRQKSVISGVTKYIAMMYASPPADFGLWLADTGRTLGFLPQQVHAQGIGFSGLSALLPLWKAFRNIAYFLLAIVMVVIGFMVMLRKKIDPKTVVTVQNALPKIIVTLLLITFSYAIVGIMIDLMYLLILLIVGVFQSTPGLLPDPSWIAKTLGYGSNQVLFSQGGLLANIWNIFGVPIPIPGAGNAGGITTPTNVAYQALGIDPTAGKITSGVSFIVGIIAAASPIGPWGLLLAAPAGLSILLATLVSLALLFLVIKLFIFFVTSYLQIILALIFSPLQLVLEAIPGSNSFSNWMKNLLANLSVFPIGAAIFMLSAIFANIANQPTGSLWTPPFTPLLGASIRSVAALVSIAILFTIPTIAGQIKEALKPKPFISAGPEGVVGAFGQPAGLAMQIYQLWVSHQSMQAFRGIAGLEKGK